jgi:1,4-alpha-glucan branching enzyme
LTIAEFSARSAGFADYRALAREILEQESSVESDLPSEIAPARPRLVEEGVLFTLAAPGAYRVQLAGDFNGWIADGNEMEPRGGVWTKVMPLPPGRYQYRYVVDGRWFADPSNIEVEPAPWGGYNSVVNLEGRDIQDRT